MKGGTTSLYYYISSHPDIEPSSIKETDFFKTTDDFSKGLNWYKALWKDKGTYTFEASPNYTKRHIFPGVPERMYSILPHIKLIYILRDPIERIVSHYIHNYAHGRESRPFSEAIKDANSNYIQTSKYYFQLQAYLEYYQEEKILIIESEKLHKDPVKVLDDVFAFLGVAAEYNDKNAIFEKRFHTSGLKRRRSFIEQELSKKISNRFLLRAIRKISKPFKKTIKRPVLSSVEREILSAEIAPDVEKLRRFSGIDFSDWARFL